MVEPFDNRQEVCASISEPLAYPETTVWPTLAKKDAIEDEAYSPNWEQLRDPAMAIAGFSRSRPVLPRAS